jgi:formylglycine-generating enzyme
MPELTWSAFSVVWISGISACGSVQATHPNDKDAAVDGAPADVSGEFLSCKSLTKTCGSAADDNCCNSSALPSGVYYRSYDLAGDPQSGTMNFPATVSEFSLDKYVVTVGRFRAFVQAGMGTQTNPPKQDSGAHVKIPVSGWDVSWNENLPRDISGLMADIKCDATFQTWTDIPGSNENRPINCVSWYEAMAFCIWDGGYLPTETEWNYAAAGGSQQRAYPWSNGSAQLTIDSLHASYDDGTGCIGDGMPACAVTDLVPVGIKLAGDSRWGQSDLAGNVHEWTLDWIGAYTTPCLDCANLASATRRVVRGGAFDGDINDLRTSSRSSFFPIDRKNVNGIRCARDQK